MIPKVDTFEGDISYEIKRKEASLTEISAASNNVGNNDDIILPKKTPVFLIALVTFFILCVISLGALAYFYFNDSILSPTPSNTTISQASVPKNKANITTLSPTLANEIGRFITNVEKKDQGYILTISDYSPVFAYMNRNENDYIGELALLFGESAPSLQGLPQISTSTPIRATTTSAVQAITTTVVATSSLPKTVLKTSTSTKSTILSPSPQLSTTTSASVVQLQIQITNPYFSDITLSNQNMRVWISGNHMVVYAFVGNNTVLISNTKEGILNLRSAILH
jgi:hypothetical protein